MAELTDQAAPLSAEDTARLTDFARACKAAARAVVLYPAGHPAIAATLGRIAQITSTGAMPKPLTISVLPDGLLLDERPPAKPDTAIAELAVILHAHLIGQLTVHPGGDVDAWRSFLLLLGRSLEAVRADGGIARVWTTMAGRHIEMREIDYAEVLRERGGGEAAVWNKVIGSCLQGSAFELDDAAISDLLGIVGDPVKLSELMAGLEVSVDVDGGIGAKTAALLRMMRGIVEVVSKNQPEQLEPVLHNLAAAVGQLSPSVLLGLLGHRGDDEGPQVVQAVVSRMSDGTIARFVSKHVRADGTPTDRLAQAFQTLVRDGDQQQRLLALAKDDAAASPLGSTEGFESAWNNVAEKLLTSYSDESYVSEDYGRELSGARTQAILVEQVNDDPPERVSAWLSTIATSALRALDLTLILDLLRIEPEDDRWGDLMTPVVGLLEDLLLVGDFDAALEVIAVLVHEVGGDGSTDRRQHAHHGDRPAHRRVDDAPHHDAPGHDRGGAVRAGEGDVRVARRSAGPPARRGVVGGSAAAHSRTADVDSARVRIGWTADDRTSEDLGEPGRPPDRHLHDAAVRRERRAAGSAGAAGRHRAAGAA